MSCSPGYFFVSTFQIQLTLWDRGKWHHCVDDSFSPWVVFFRVVFRLKSVQMMAWHRPGQKPVSSNDGPFYWRMCMRQSASEYLFYEYICNNTVLSSDPFIDKSPFVKTQTNALEMELRLTCTSPSRCHPVDVGAPGVILCMRPANERRRCNVTSSLTGWAHSQNDRWRSHGIPSLVISIYRFPIYRGPINITRYCM